MSISQLEIRSLAADMEANYKLSDRATLLFELAIETYEIEVVADLYVPLGVYRAVIFGPAFAEQIRLIGRRDGLAETPNGKRRSGFTAQAFFHFVMDRRVLQSALELPDSLVKEDVINENDFNRLSNRHQTFFRRLDRK